MAEAIPGVIHGRTIELSSDPGLGNGQAVEVVVRAVDRPDAWGEGIRRSAGAMARHWTDEDDRILEGLHRDRQSDDRPALPG